MPAMGTARPSAPRSPRWDCTLWWASSLRRRSGNRDNNPCRRQRENQAGVRPPSACGGVRIISPFRRSSWPWACRLRRGKTSVGAKVVQKLCAHASPLFACVLPIAITSAPNPTWKKWLLIEWPKTESEPTKYWLSTLPVKTSLKSLVKTAKHRWIIERDYEELKQELGLGHYEGRGWRGFHHHASLCIAAYGFLISERNRFSPSARAGHVGLRAAPSPPGFRPRGSRPSRAA